jgi:hypothetical protein
MNDYAATIRALRKGGSSPGPFHAQAFAGEVDSEGLKKSRRAGGRGGAGGAGANQTKSNQIKPVAGKNGLAGGE